MLSEGVIAGSVYIDIDSKFGYIKKYPKSFILQVSTL
jgi:hypothetical protein